MLKSQIKIPCLTHNAVNFKYHRIKAKPKRDIGDNLVSFLHFTNEDGKNQE